MGGVLNLPGILRFELVTISEHNTLSKMDMEEYRHPQYKYAYRRPKEGLQLPKGKVNIVHDEQIWRDHIKTETQTLKQWESKWGFTKDVYKEMYDGVDKQESRNSRSDYPETSQNEYGWKQPSPLYKALEKSERPKMSIHQRLKWPVDGCN